MWSKIPKQAFGGHNAVDPSRMKSLRQEAPPNRHLLFYLLRPPKSDTPPIGREYLSVLESLYSSIQDITDWENSSRMEDGPITLRLDHEWRTELALSDRLTVSALSWPLLLRYGYFT